MVFTQIKIKNFPPGRESVGNALIPACLYTQ